MTSLVYCGRFGYVDFMTEKLAKKALKLNGTELAGRPIKIDKANAPFQTQSPGFRGRGGTPRGGNSMLFIELVCNM